MWIELETIHLNEINFSVRYLCMLCYILHSFPLFIFLPFSNEREGIPANLLQMLDVCVEIPQQGIIRSLNVHVSAALLIWEYTRQHLSSGSAEVDSKRSWWRHLMLTSLCRSPEKSISWGDFKWRRKASSHHDLKGFLSRQRGQEPSALLSGLNESHE